LPLLRHAPLTLPDLGLRAGEPRAALVELRLLVRDLVLLAQLALVGLDLLGECRAQRNLALLGRLQLSSEVFDLGIGAVQLDRSRLLEVVAHVLRVGLLSGRGLLGLFALRVQPLAQLCAETGAEAAFGGFGLALFIRFDVAVLTEGHRGFAPSRRSSGR